MSRLIVATVLGMTIGAGLLRGAAAPPPGMLSPEERKVLDTQLQEFTSAGVKHYQAGKLPEATVAFEKGLATARRLYPWQDHPELARSLNNLAGVLQARGKYAEAEPLCREALVIRRRLHPGQNHPELAESVNNVAFVLKARGKYAEAEPLFREALAMDRRLHPGQDHPGSGEEVAKPKPGEKAHPRLWAAFSLSGPGR